jgi:nicotinate phosphoribosyltransferase
VAAEGFHVATPEDIRTGKVTDVYFIRGRQVLEAEGENPHVVAEIRASSLPRRWPWAVLAGLDEALALLEGRGVDVEAIPEGSVFAPEEPVLVLSGPYLEFGLLETALLGLLCQATGVATVAARCKLAAAGRPVYSFGARRMHPAVSPMIERAAYVGGCDGVAAIKSAEEIGLTPVGTMAHAVILILGEERAWRAFDRIMEPEIPRVALVDTFQDEKFGALAAARVLGDRLWGVRLDTPSSRRGDFGAIIREVRWELDRIGSSGVRIFASGGMDEGDILELNPWVDAYGVGTWISNAPVVDFAMDLVEVDGQARAKRGKLSGRKQLWACPECGHRGVSPVEQETIVCPRCGHDVIALLQRWMEGGKIVGEMGSPEDARRRSLEQVGAAADPFESTG